MLACDDTDLPNLSFPILVHPADTEIFYNHLRRCRLGSRGRVVTELRLRSRSKTNGTVRDLPVQLVSVPAGHNGQVVFRTVLVDLTATKAAERAAHDSMIYAEQIIQTVQHPLVIVDSGLRVQTVNAAFCRVFRDEARRIESQPLQELETVRWKDDELLLRLKEVIQSGESLSNFLTLCRFRGSGRELAFLINASRFYSGASPFALVTFEEITERIRVEGELLQARQSLEKRVSDRTSELALANEGLRALSQNLEEAQDRERRVIARELHDEIGQILTGLRFFLEHGLKEAPRKMRRTLREARDLTDYLQQRVQTLCLALPTPLLEEAGLVGALIGHFRNYRRHTQIKVDFQHRLPRRRLAPEIERTAFRIIQEALTNVARHAGVKNVAVRLWADPQFVGLQVADNGRGFETKKILRRRISCGLSGIRERAEIMGGQCTIESETGKGTRLTVELPLKQRPAAMPIKQ